MKRHKLLLISMHFYPEPTGSAVPISDFARWLAANGVGVETITARPSYPLGRVFDSYQQGTRDNETWEEVHIQRLASWISRKRGLVGRLVSELSFAVTLIGHRMFGSNDIQANVVSVCPSIFTVLAAHLFRPRDGCHVVIIHDIQSGLGTAVMNAGPAMGLLRWLERLTFNCADHIVTLSVDMGSALRDLGVAVDITVLPPQIDTTEITPQEERDDTLPIVLYSGAFGRKQGLMQIIDAAAILEKRGVHCRFVLRGHGGIEDELRAAVDSRDLSCISIEPLRPRDEINDAFADGTVHLVPQLPAGQDFAVPSKVFSIMSAGRPFIGTALDGSPLHHLAKQSGGGICVQPNHPEAFADAIEALIGDASRRRSLGEAGRKYVVEHVDREIVCAELARVARVF